VPADQEPPSYEVLAALVASLRMELVGVRAELARALERVAELEARLAQSPRSLRKRSGRRPGGQDGHKGATLAQVAWPDRQVRHEPGCCCRCGAGLASRLVTWVERRQVFDLPQVRAEVTGHRLIERECGCGHRTRAAAPPGAGAPACYGPGLAAVIILLYAGLFLSKQRTAAALAELFGIALPSGTVAALTGRAAGQLGGFLDFVREQVAGSAVAGFDETGFRVEGRLAWVHCARTGRYTLLTVHPRRGRRAMEAMGVLPGFTGVAVHDAWSPYDSYTGASHQLCCAHALRELQAGTDAAPAGRWCWASQAAGALTAMQKLVSEAIAQGRDGVDRAALAAQVHACRSAAVIGARQTAGRCGKLTRKHYALAHRLIDRQDDYLRFTCDFRAPPDSNGCERDLHMAKLKQKVSGCLPTMTGARQFCAIRSYLSTAAKHGLTFFGALVMLTHGRPWVPAAAWPHMPGGAHE
jgi:transposase